MQIKNGGSLEVNGAHAGKTGHTSEVWTSGSAGGGGGIVHILAKRVFITTGAVSLTPGNSTGCANEETASPGYLSIRGLFEASIKCYLAKRATTILEYCYA